MLLVSKDSCLSSKSVTQVPSFHLVALAFLRAKITCITSVEGKINTVEKVYLLVNILSPERTYITSVSLLTLVDHVSVVKLVLWPHLDARAV